MTTWRIIKWMVVPTTAIAIGTGTLVATAAPAAAPAGRPAVAAVLLEDAACTTPAAVAAALPTPEAVTTATGAATATAQVVLKVTIPPVAWLEVDEAGRLVAAATNTGCAPRTGDTVVARRPDRTVVRELTIDLDEVAWVGDFTEPAVLEPQTDHVVVGHVVVGR